MNFTTWMLVLFCGLTLAQNDVNETEISGETKLRFPEMSLLLVELGAVKAKLEAVETKLKETESQVLVLNEKGKSLETKLEGTESQVLVLNEKGKSLETKLKETESQVLVLNEKGKSLETKLKETESQVLVLNEKGKSLETKLKETESQVLVLKDKEATKVVFSAGIGGGVNIGPFTTSKTLAYTTVITNLGNAYNQHTGIFVAPVRGIYYFSFFYHAGGGYPVTLRLMKNNQIVLESTDYKTSHDAADNGGNAGLVELQQRDQVYVQLYANTHVWGNIHTTTFSGFLLHKV